METPHHHFIRETVCAAVVFGSSLAFAQPLSVMSVRAESSAVGISKSADTSVMFEFDKPVDPATVDSLSISAFGRWSGMATGTISFEDSNKRLVFNPDKPFSAGESVTVVLSNDVKGSDGSEVRSAGYTYQFWTDTTPMEKAEFVPLESLSTLLPTETKSVPYGGIATDLNNDGWLDITTANEGTNDLRVFLNKADGTGTFSPVLTPTVPVGIIPSPSEPADFNRDGNADIVVINTGGSGVSFLLGNGDGTFAPQQLIHLDGFPWGVTVLDADGDGDTDVVATTSSAKGDLALLVNDGDGVFGSPTFLNSGVSSPQSVMAGDMNNDGISDLVAAGFDDDDETIRVLLGDGSGSFTAQTAQVSGGRAYQMVLGDLNGDGFMDVTTANRGDVDSGAVFFGDGAGGLSQPDIYNLTDLGDGGNTDPVATDLGDMDGDGDLDWIVSNVFGSWIILTNDGSGQFEFFDEIDPHVTASCGLVFDIDNDGDLDLGLIDEIGNVVITMENVGVVPEPSTVSLVMLGLLVGLGRRRGRIGRAA